MTNTIDMKDSPAEKAVHAFVQAGGDDPLVLEVATHVVIRMLITDLMHYCDDLNTRDDRRGYVPLDPVRIIEDARERYLEERAA